MKILRENIMFRLVWLTLAMHVFNCSAHTPDLQPCNLPEDVEYNEMDSVVEVVLEMILEMEGVVPENDDNDEEGKFQIKHEVDFSDYKSNLRYFIKSASVVKSLNSDYFKILPEAIHFDFVPPPPKA